MDSLFDTIEKPTLLLNESLAQANIQRMAEKARAAGVRFRPHFKTHQSAEIGEWFRAEGVNAITTSSVDMALYFARHGWNDITIAFPANIRQAKTMAELAQRIQLGLLVESPEAVKRLAEVFRVPVDPQKQIDLWIKVDVGAHRTGLRWDDPAAAARVVEAVRNVPAFRLRGLLTHAGHTYGARGAQEVCQRYAESVEHISAMRCNLQEMGFDGMEISVGDTPGTSLCANLGPVDEIRPGNFVFYDTQQMQIGSCGWQDVAVALACPVVAKHPERGEMVVYGGAVHLSKDFTIEDGQKNYGLVCLPEGDHWSAPLANAYVSGLSQEHGILHLSEKDLANMQIGDLVCILPAHSCLTVTLMKRYKTLRGQEISTLNEE